MSFEPIAIVGRACVLPGALSPEELWQAVVEGRDLLGPAPDDRWGIAKERILTADPSRSDDACWSDRGGYVRGFERVFDPSGFAIPADEVKSLDPLFQWVLHTARAALSDARFAGDRARVGAIFGNLSFPSSSMSRYAERVWLGDAADVVGLPPVDARNRFMSGLPAHVLAHALGLGVGAYALDAACASSLYAIKLACDALHDRRADAMLAGAVNRADDLFIHVGFCALNALSKRGRSTPFDAGADGLVPGEGAGFVLLKRLGDALRDGDTIHGVIRGVGLSNDGRGRGMLAPSEDGQVRAMRSAYAQAGLEPSSVQYVECHATGTPVGDATEIRSMSQVFGTDRPLPMGSLKANMGHLITAAGVGGLIKVLEALRHGVVPPTPHVTELNHAIAETGFRPVSAPSAWPTQGVRRAAVSAFGFGGNNAHLVVEQLDPSMPYALPAPVAPVEIAIVGIGARVADGTSAEDFAGVLSHASSRVRPRDEAHVSAHADEVVLGLGGLRFPPNDLSQTLAQQTLLLAAAREAVEGLSLPAERTSILVGSQCDPEVARYGARWRTAEWAASLGLGADWVARAREAFVPVLRSAGVLGTMPNIPANRMNSQFDLSGPSFTVASEELSGIRALEIASRWLAAGELDAAVVGAVDVASEPVHEASARALLGPGRQVAGDAAVVLVLKRLEDARRHGDAILAVIGEPDDTRPYVPFGVTRDQSTLSSLVGDPHAATGLLHVLAAAIAVGRGITPGGGAAADRARVLVESLLGQRALVCLRDEPGASKPTGRPAPEGSVLRFPAHPATPVVPPLPVTSRAPMTQLMAPAPTLPPTHVDHVHSPVAAPVPVPVPTPAPAALPAPMAPAPMAAAQVAVAPAPYVPSAAFVASPASSTDSVYARFAAYQQQLASMHQEFLAQQSAVHQQFLAMQQNALFGLAATATRGMAMAPAVAGSPVVPAASLPAPVAPAALPPAPLAAPAPVVARPAPVAAPTPTVGAAPIAPPVAPLPVGATKPAAPAQPAVSTKSAAPAPVAAKPAAAQGTKPKAGSREIPISTKPVTGPSWDRKGLEIHAGGTISEIFGPLFEQQDRYDVQVRMPEPPLLLADRVIGIDAVPGSMGKGTVWTETDVRKDSWWLNEGYMPAGIMIESGQADLFLISYLGIDFLNKGERAYRLLGCELTYHGNLPTIGETLRYDIHVDGHANHGDVRIFFFHYDCHVNGRRGLSVREGQAGFFTKQELAESAGILWKPEEQEIVPNARVDAPAVPSVKSSFTRDELQAFADGHVLACFGPGYEFGETHNRTPRIQGGRMLFHDAITHLDPKGGPWKRGYMRSVQKISPDDWFFDGHFKNDPCMPGTLMFEGCLQMMSFYLAAMGYTLKRDGWRFQPIPEEKYQLLCRGQVIPTSKELVYEIFVEEVHDGPIPKLYADLLCTVDGLGAFHARRMGLELVPDWPLTSWTELLEGHVEPKPVATIDGFEFGYDSLLACAWAKPSKAFGKMYEVFDGTRRVARLPGPPYHFMSRVTRIDGDIGVCKPGAVIEIEYDVPPGEWYFHENGYPTMPFCVFLEAALQPCGWLASFVGSALTVDEDLSFRNLDGNAKFLAEVFPTSGTFRTVVKITNISQSAGMIIESFDVMCYVGDTPVYELKTVFGFFPLAALENQVGLPVNDHERGLLDAPSDFRVDLTQRPAKYCEGPVRLANPMLLMLDRVTAFDPKGGKKGLGFARGEKDVDVSEWFFKAHFFQDPVQPGSLGIEAMIQLLQFFMLETGMAEGIENPRFEPIAVQRPHAWKYRGQVVPKNKLISSTLEIVETGRDERGAYALCDASLWVDGKRIYEAKGLGMRIVSGPMGGPDPKTLGPYTVTGGAPSKKAPDRAGASVRPSGVTGSGEVVLDPAVDAWLVDHEPTWTLPALPMMSMVDRLAGALGVVPGTDRATLRDVQVRRWLPIEQPTRTRVDVKATETGPEASLLAFREARDPKLSRFEPVATGRLSIEPIVSDAPLPPLENAVDQPDPYAEGTLFHGPAFRYLVRLAMGSNGSTAILDASQGSVPHGSQNQGLLDALTHGIPHDRLHLFSDRIPTDLVAYPYRIPYLRFASDAPRSGEVRVETRFDGFDGNERFPAFRVQAFVDDRLWVELRLVEILLAKGPIGSAEPWARLAFLRDHRFVPGLGLSRLAEHETRLRESEVKASDWLPGTVAGAYGAAGDLVRSVAVKDHVGQRAHVHPRSVIVAEDGAYVAHEPLRRHPLALAVEGDDLVVRDAGLPHLDVEPVRAFWSRWFGIGRWPVEDIYYGLIERFVGSVHVEDPAALSAVRGRPVLFLGNHQVGIESLLFSVIASALVETPTLTLAKVEHQETWLGKLIQHCFRYPGARDPGVIAYFDRTDPESLPRIVRTLGAGIAGEAKSLMVHVEGTRSLECRTPVTKMSGVFVDLAIQAKVPVVPVRFTGGLPVDPLGERIEFPIGMGRQDYWLGRPIAPEELAALPYKQRIERVTSAINGLGPSNADERPGPADPELERRVAARVARTGSGIGHATILEVLLDLASPGDELATLLEGVRSGRTVFSSDAKGEWLAELARRLLGPSV